MIVYHKITGWQLSQTQIAGLLNWVDSHSPGSWVLSCCTSQKQNTFKRPISESAELFMR